MGWARLDDGFNEHPKIRAVSLAARWTFISSLCYAGRRRNPTITPPTLPLLDATTRVARELEAAGLWDTTPDGWVIHDWDQYQGPRTDAERQRDRRRGKDDANG